MMTFRRILTSVVSYGAVACEVLFGWFMYQSINKVLSQIYSEDESAALPAVYITLAAIFSFINFAEDVLSINPAEEAYEASLEHEENSALAPAGSFITSVPAYLFFFIAACADSVPILDLMSRDELKYPKYIISTIPIVFTVAYYRMFSYQDMLEHHQFIYGKIFSWERSVVKDMIKSPMRSLEVLLTVGVNVVMRSILYGFVALQFVPAYVGKSSLSNASNIAVFSISAFVTAYATLFSRLKSTLKTFFPENASDIHYDGRPKISSLLPGVLLRFMRSSGIIYFVIKGLNDRSAKIGVGSPLSIFLLLHSIYVTFVQEEIKQNSQQSTNTISRSKHLLAMAINLLSKIGFCFLLMASCFDLNDRFDFGLEKLEVIFLSQIFSIPMNLNNFDYYSLKLTEAMQYYSDKYTVEQREKLFGKFGCLFRSIKEYPESSSDESTEQDTLLRTPTSYQAINQ